jgi:hypothetical protein
MGDWNTAHTVTHIPGKQGRTATEPNLHSDLRRNDDQSDHRNAARSTTSPPKGNKPAAREDAGDA